MTRARLPHLVAIDRRDRSRRLLWKIVRKLLYRPTPVLAHRWRCTLLRAFGATIHDPAYPYPDAAIWAPWNLAMEAGSCLASGTICYNVAQVRLGRRVIVSQYSHLCAASHDFDDPEFPLTGAPIVIEEGAWVAADVFVGPGVTIGARAVVLARGVVVRDVPPHAVVAGNPARHLRDRVQVVHPRI